MSLNAMATCAWLCLSVGLPGPEGAGPPEPTPAFEVMQIKSGLEIVVKRDGKPTPVRLLGIDTPRTAGRPNEVERLSQTQHLRTLLKVGSYVRLAASAGATPDTGAAVLTQVYRDVDGLWVNRAMIEAGFAATTPEPPHADRAAFEALVAQAKEQKRGMWATDFLAHAAKPTRFERVAPSRAYRSRGAPNPVVGPVVFQQAAMPNLGFGFPAINNAYSNAVGMAAWGNAGWGGTGGLTGTGPSFYYPPQFFSQNAFGYPISEAEKNRRFSDFNATQQQQQQAGQRFAETLLHGIQGGQTTQPGVGIGMPAQGQSPPHHREGIDAPTAPAAGASHTDSHRRP